MPAYNGVIPSVISMSYYLEVANASSVTIVTAGGLALQSDLEALADRVTIIEQAAVKKYGARKKVGQQSCGAESWERLGGAVGLTAIQRLQTVQPFRRQKSHRIPGRRQLLLDRR